MDYINQEAFAKTMDSYQTAMQQLFAISRNIVPGSNRWNDSLSCEWRMEWSPIAIANRVQYTDRLHISQEQLFDFGRPKLSISHIWFLRLTAFKEVEFQKFGVRAPQAGNAAYVDEDGEDHPARPYKPETLKPQKQLVKLQLFEKIWDLKEYRANRADIWHFMDAAPDNVVEQYHEAMTKADAEIEKYNEAIGKLKTV